MHIRKAKMFLFATLLCSIVACVLGNCPEGRCKSDETCCPTPSGYYGCCRMPKATCCPDGKRCCPEGMECGIDQCTVIRQLNTLEKRQLEDEHTTVVDTTTLDLPTHDAASVDTDSTTTESYASRLNLCNRRSYCPSTYQCCVEQSGFYNCCPPNSICCRNSGHCCPEGTQCDLVTGRCRPVNPYFSKRQGLIENYDENEANINRCDKQFYCPDEYSCCMRPNGVFGCCPYPNAVCCSDRLHCCQEGETCDEDSRMCIKDEMKMPTFGMEKAVPFLNEDGDL